MGEITAKTLVDSETANTSDFVLRFWRLKLCLGLVAGCGVPWCGCTVQDGLWGWRCGELVEPWQEREGSSYRLKDEQRVLDSLSGHQIFSSWEGIGLLAF